MTKIFTYGTLKRGFTNAPLLEDEEFIGTAVSADANYRLYQTTKYRYPFPALIEDAENGYQVYGELYEVSDRILGILDRLEGVDVGLYHHGKIKVQVVTSTGEIQEVDDVLTYFFGESLKDTEHSGPSWPSKKLSGLRLADKKVVRITKEEELHGVRLWDKKQDRWMTNAFDNLDELKKHCATRPNKFAVEAGSKEYWSPNYFEVRSFPLTLEKQYFSFKQEGSGAVLSPEFESLGELAEWAAEHSTFFGGAQGSAGLWKKVLDDVVLGELTILQDE